MRDAVFRQPKRGRRSRAGDTRNRVVNAAERAARSIGRRRRKVAAGPARRGWQPVSATIGGADCSHRKYSFP
ncbi:hypothetical protein BURMUCGD1_5435 [Burkholderia multivorans CGD1]|nr:hypothetical protein BURMUCGD1_5435 [Burkholderia multivorans CGD1]